MAPLRLLFLGAFIDVEPLFVAGVPLSEPAWRSACENTISGGNRTIGQTLCGLMAFRRHFRDSQEV